MQKLSRSKIELFTNCPRCFWLDVKHKIKRPPSFPYTINSAIDYLLKQEFDACRAEGSPHPLMTQFNVDAIPYQTEHMNRWRHNFTGIQHEHQDSGFLVFGAVDDVWVNPKEELMVVDYKATGAKQYKIYDSYARQMEIYQWLLKQNGYAVSPRGYFVFAKVNKAKGFEGGKLSFDLAVEYYDGKNDWVDATLMQARACLEGPIPATKDDCKYCSYAHAAYQSP